MFKRREFERVTPESVGVSSGIVEWLLDQLESGFTEPHGLMLMRHGKIFAEGWWNPYAPGIRHGEQSHSKTYAATAVGIACTEGLLNLEEKIIDIFPEEAPANPSEYLQQLKVKHVLCMGCGMDEMPRPTENWIRDFLHTPVLHEPGTTYMYNSVGSTLLGAIVRKKTGLGLHEYLKPRLYDKIGIFGDNHVWMCMPDGMEVGGGGLYAATEDNLRLMKLYADGGIWEGERILSEGYVEKAVSLQNESATESVHNPEAYDNFLGYGYQIWMCKPKGVYRADGAMGQFTIVVPDMDMIIAITENASGAHWAQKTLDTMWEFLTKLKESPAVEANPAAAEKLQKRMRALSLPAPVYAPYSPMASELQEKVFRVDGGSLYFTNSGAMQIMAGGPAEDAVERFHFRFTEDTAVLYWKAGETEESLVIAMDGSRRWNYLKEEFVKQTLASGFWKTENIFVMHLRRIETCCEDVYSFTFSGNTVTIDKDTNMLFAIKQETITASCQSD